jgi:hypothetical protein
MRSVLSCLALALTASTTIACAHGPPSSQPQSPGPASSGSADSAAQAAQVVNATVLTNGCQSLGRANAKLAESAMVQLVEGCSSVPGGSAEFEATLEPGGRITIAAAPGQPDVVPICILKHSLLHKVALAKPCRLEVKIAQSSVPLAIDAGAAKKP